MNNSAEEFLHRFEQETDCFRNVLKRPHPDSHPSEGPASSNLPAGYRADDGQPAQKMSMVDGGNPSTKVGEDEAGILAWASGYDPPLPDQVLNLCKPEDCLLCGTSGFSGPAVALSHYWGKPHSSKATSFLHDWVANTGNTLPQQQRLPWAASTDVSSEQDQSSTKDGCCAICKVTFTSEVMALYHYRGKKHLNRAKQSGSTTSSEVRKTGSSTDGRSTAAAATVVKFYCLSCWESFPGEAEYASHMAGSKHLEVCRQALANDTPNNSAADCLDTSGSNPINDAQAELLAWNAPTSSSSSSSSSWGPYSCSICQITTTDQAGLEDHFRGKKHMKKLAGSGFGHNRQPAPIQSDLI